LARPAVIFDVGANIGFYSLTLARAFPDCVVHGFEPDPEIFKIFMQNCRLNGLKNVRPQCLGLSDVQGKSMLYRERGATGDNAGMGHLAALGDITVTTDTVDHYCEVKGIDRIDFLKADVEGAELLVLLGAARLLGERKIGLLMLELCEWQLSRFRAAPAEVWNWLVKMGYEGFRLRRGSLCIQREWRLPEGNFLFLPRDRERDV
jgi:FkbM family methyltransferase